ncbi:MAG TPA: sugar-binding protein, partial [Candidatus Baltobacteraceae bacterium]
MLAAALLLAQVTTPATTYVGTRVALPAIDKPPVMDGTLADPEWKSAAAKVQIGWNLRDQQPAREATTAYLMTDGRYLYVGFDAQQREPVQAGQHTNDTSLTDNDYVAVYFWPNGSNGFEYEFEANPNGTHLASSSENTAYAPRWQSAAHLKDGGYTVTMRIPLSAIKGTAGGAWGMQLARYVASTQDDYVWQHAPVEGQGMEAMSIYSGFLAGVPSQQASRPKPRIGLYELGELASKSIGGSTSRIGADISIPITATTSFVSTLHPDYSNVELDQQTIQPTAYQRFYQEVRPFFTQLANFYNNGTCVGCMGQELYTPSIPTPRAGFAVEGKQGPASFAAFDAIGIDGRRDDAETVSAHTADTKSSFMVQRVGVNMPGLNDDVTYANVSHDSLKGLFEYAGYGTETGSLVVDRAQALREELGIGVYAPNGGIFAALRRIGGQYNPVDGFMQHSDVAGYDVNGNYTWYYKSAALFPRVIVAANVDRYHGTDTGLNQADQTFAAGADVSKRWHIRLQTGASYLRLNDGTFTPITQNGIDVYFHYHTPTVTQLSWYTGRFGPGTVDSWTRATTLKAGPRGYLSFEADSNRQWL